MMVQHVFNSSQRWAMRDLLKCPTCHVGIKLPENYTGKRLRCPRCSKVFRPQSEGDAPNEQRSVAKAQGLFQGGTSDSIPEEFLIRSATIPPLVLEGRNRTANQKKILLGTLVPAGVCFVGFLFWVFVIRWEDNHRSQILRLSEETVSLMGQGDSRAGVEKFDELLRLVGNRSITSPDLNQAMTNARQAAETAKKAAEAQKRRADEEKRLADLHYREAAALAKLRDYEIQIGTLIKNQEFKNAAEISKQALDFIDKNKAENPEFAAATQRISEAKHQCEDRLAEAARYAEQQRQDAENESKGLVKVDDKWISKEQAELVRIRAEMEALKNKPGKVIVTVTWKYNDFVGNKPDTGAVVLLLPDGLKQRLPGNWINPMLSSTNMLRNSFSQEAAKFGVLIAIVGGDGKAVFNRVKPGRYTAVIVSKNTREQVEIVELQEKALCRWFDKPTFGVHKSTTLTIEVDPGEDYLTSHDFGLTFW